MSEKKYKCRSKPLNYGKWWGKESDFDWYEFIFEDCKTMHQIFISWFSEKELLGEKNDSILEIGCGRAIVYADLFRDKRYVGYDISKKEIEWCRKNRKNPNHNYIHGDFIEKGINEKFDLVFSHAVIDHVYDINSFIHSMVRASKKWIYITSYRGWFPELKTHKYSWNENETCFFNDISPHEVKKLLQDLQCSEIEIYPLPTGHENINYRTIISAKCIQDTIEETKQNTDISALIPHLTVKTSHLEQHIFSIDFELQSLKHETERIDLEFNKKFEKEVLPSIESIKQNLNTIIQELGTIRQEIKQELGTIKNEIGYLQQQIRNLPLYRKIRKLLKI